MNRRTGLLLLGLVGLGILAWGSWIPLKGLLAQALLERAWAAGSATAAPRPWPWADTRPVGRLRVPRLGVDLIILAGDSGRTLAFGPGLAAGSAPLDRTGTHLVSGHRDTHFSFLGALREDDRIELERPDGSRRRYRVSGTAVVDARTTAFGADSDRLLLATCWPLETPVPGGSLRYLVTAAPLAPRASLPGAGAAVP